MTQTIVNPEQEFLLSRQHQAHTQEQPIESKVPISALEAAGDLVGCLEAPSDLSLHKKLFKQKAIVLGGCLFSQNE